MNSNETHEMSQGQTPVFTVIETAPQPDGAAAQPFTCDLCYGKRETAVKHRLNGLRLCEECHRDLWAMPEFTRTQIQKFLIGNVC